MTEYSNPRTFATVEDWPSGRHRVTARFWVESDPRRGERACRETEAPGRQAWGRPKRLTYARAVRIVYGDDGRVYIAQLTPSAVSVMRGTFDVQHEWVSDTDPRYPKLRELFS